MGSLTQLQKSVVIGSLLGDGYARIVPGRKNAFLEINHSFKAKEYVDWKFDILKNICVSPPKMRSGNKGRIAYRFFTKQHPELTGLYKIFYPNGKKIVPSDFILDTDALSIWFMDDGGSSGKKNIYLNTQQFNVEHQQILLKKLQEMGLKATLNRDKAYYRIRFLASSMEDLRNMLRNKIIPSMQYKLGYNPVET